MKRPNPHTLPPDFRSKEQNAMKRDIKIVININKRELEAIERYQESLGSLGSLGGKISRSAICREAIMEKILRELSENQPTLF